MSSPPEHTATRTDFAPLLAPYAKRSLARVLIQLANTIAPFVLLWWGLIESLRYGYWLTILLAIPTGGLMLRLFILMHDCSHGSFFGSRIANDICGFLLGVVTLAPYHYWKRTHALHHANSGNLDYRADIGYLTLCTVREYLALSPSRRLLYRIYRNIFFLLFLGLPLQWVVKHRFPWDTPASWRREWLSIWATNALLAAVVIVMTRAIGLGAFLAIEAPILLTFCIVGGWILYVQHTFEGGYWATPGEWRFEEASVYGASYFVLPSILNWFSADVGAHHVHHMHTRIPNYRLDECLRNHRPLQQISRVTPRDSLRALRLTLWDEERRKMVGFADVGKSIRAEESRFS
jgi:omega-6 fatty acid desaturase (delta-12 desaturase)